MKLLEKWKDKYYFATNYIFETDNGLKIYYTHKADIFKTFFDFSMLGGSQIEASINVPDGTAHFAEHLMCNPNLTLDTKDKMKDFKFGNRLRPQLRTNAATSRKEMWLTSDSNSKGFSRMLNYLKYQLQVDFNKLFEDMETERSTILAEEHRYKPIDKDSGIAYDKFMLDDYYPEFTKRILGTPETINKITKENIKTYLEKVFNVNNCYFSIQSNLEPTDQILKDLEEFSSSITFFKGSKFEFVDKAYKPVFKKDHFFDETQQGLFFSLDFIQSFNDSIDYKSGVYRYLVDGTFRYIANEVLREMHGYIYSADIFNSNYAWNYRLRGIKMTVKKENILNTFNALNSIIQEEIIKFLNSKKGETWFKSLISNYIFYPPEGIDPDYASTMGRGHFVGIGMYNYDYGKSIEQAKLATIAELIEEYKKAYLNAVPAVWFQSAYPKEEIFAEFEKSDLNKVWGGK